MPKFFRARTSKEVVAFLVAHGYKHTNTNGDDDIYAKDNCAYPVKVAHRNEVIPMGTMDYIRQIIQKGGHSRKDILNWWKNNGYGE